MRGFVVLAALMVSSSVFGQECIRPEWGKCVSFPNGGSHTGTSIQKKRSRRRSLRSRYLRDQRGGDRRYTFARFGRNGAPWPNADWAANVDDFCFFKK